MTKTHILRSLCLLALIVPTTTLAYMSPEEVLTSDQNQMYFDPPPSPRQTQQTQAQQQSSDAALRAQQQAALFSSSSSAAAMQSSSEDLHGAAPGTTDQASSTPSQQDLIDQRILERIKANQLAAQAQADAQVLASQQSLHGGAPLASSGPGTDLALLLLAAAGVWTFWKAEKMEKTN